MKNYYYHGLLFLQLCSLGSLLLGCQPLSGTDTSRPVIVLGGPSPSFTLPNRSGKFSLPEDPKESSEARASAIQSDGKIVIVGSTHSNEGSDIQPHVLVLRLNQDGTLDSTFGNQGIVKLTPAPYSFATQVAVQGDGKILVAGGSNTAFAAKFFPFLIRLNSDGTMDEPYFQNTQQFLSSAFPAWAPDYTSEVNSMLLRRDGKVMIGGYYLLSFNSDGTLDRNFYGSALKIIEGRSGEIYTMNCGVTYYSQFWWDTSIAKYDINGAEDSTFNKVAHFGYGFCGAGLSITNDNKFIAAGTVGRCPDQEQVPNYLSLRQLNSDGTLDKAFGGSGSVDVNQSANIESFYDVALGSDGSIYAKSNALLFKFTAQGELDRTFGNLGLVSLFGGSQAGYLVPALSGDWLYGGRVLMMGSLSAVYGRYPALTVVSLTLDGRYDASFGNQ